MEERKKSVKPVNRKTMQKNKIVYLPARGRIYESAVEEIAVDILDDCEEEIAAILSTPLDPEWYPGEEKHRDFLIRDGLSELVEKYLAEVDPIFDEKYVLRDDETLRSEFISDVVLVVWQFRALQYREVQEKEEDQEEEAP
jgi:hypothetical protein